jgi:hypothetical protein
MARGLLAACTGSGDHGHNGGRRGIGVPTVAGTWEGERQVHRKLEKVMPCSVGTKGEHNNSITSLRLAGNGASHGVHTSVGIFNTHR